MRFVLIDLPCDVGGFVWENPETLEKVCFLNSRLTHEANKNTALHEIDHVKNNDFDSDKSADEIESERHKEKPHPRQDAVFLKGEHGKEMI